MTKTSKLSCIAFASILLAGSLIFVKSSPVKVNAADKDYKVLLTQGSNISAYTGYQRYEGYTFNSTSVNNVPYSDSTAIVLDVENCNVTTKTALAFYANGKLNSGTSTTPTSTYLYDQNILSGVKKHESYSVGFYSGNGVEQKYNYIAVPITNFSFDAETVNVSSFTIAIRLKGIDVSYSNPNLALRGIYVTTNFKANSSLNLESLQNIYTPSSSNFTPFDSGNTGITENCIKATYSEESFVEVNVTSEHGTITYNKALPGGDVVLSSKPDAGYKLSSLKIGGIQVEPNKYGKFAISPAPSVINVNATFIQESTYRFNEGSFYSLYNHWAGTVYSDFNAINVTTIENMDEQPNEWRYIGLTIDGLAETVEDNDFIAVKLATNDTIDRSFYLKVNGVQPKRYYYVLDRVGDTSRRPISDSKLTVNGMTRFSNPTFDVNANMEGFTGYIIVPMKNYDGVNEINSIDIYTGTKTKANARFNVGDIYLTSDFNELCPDEFNIEDVIWQPGVSSYKNYVHEDVDATAELARVSYLDNNEILFNRRLIDEEDPDKNYDEYYLNLPTNIVGSDGYVDLTTLNIKGIVFDVENNNDSQIQFALRLASSDSNRLIYNDEGVWQTSVANGYLNKIIYDNGVVRQRAPAFFPYDESGTFKGSVYIPLNKSAFITGGENKTFPTKIQPVFRVIMKGISKEGYDAKICNFKFVTEESDYKANVVSLFPTNGRIDAFVGTMQIGNDKYNKVLDNTEITFTVTPDVGYSKGQVSVICGIEEEILTPDANGVYHYVVNDDVVFLFEGVAKQFNINYVLDGGENNKDNPLSFTYGGTSFTLLDPTKEGAKFVHWEDEEGNVVVQINTFTPRDITLIAIWTNSISLGLILGLSIGGGALVIGGTTTAIILIRKKKMKNV